MTQAPHATLPAADAPYRLRAPLFRAICGRAAGPVYGQEALLCAGIDLSDTIRGKYDLRCRRPLRAAGCLRLARGHAKADSVRLGEECI